MKALSSIILFVARLCLSAMFIFAGASKVIFFDQTSQYMLAKGMTLVPVFLIGAAIVELVGGLSILLGYKIRFGASILILFLIPTTLIFHSFWNATGMEQMIEQIMFLKNLAIVGGLLYVLCYGSGGCALDSCCCKPKEPEQK
ncbi:MAG: DoxX family protein [Parachlamydiaceae bacterium]